MKRPYVIPESEIALYNELKNNYRPKVGEYFFFDLSVPNYKPQMFYNMDEIKHLQYDVIPNAIVCHTVREGFPVLAYNCEAFSSEENLATNEIMFLDENTPVDLEQVIAEFKEIKKLLGTKAC